MDAGEDVLLHLGGEVDQHVAAQDQLRFAEHAIADQVVIGEGDPLLQPFIQIMCLEILML